MTINIIASGSKGNATLLLCHDTLLLIDLGVTKTRLVNALQELNKSINDISGLLLTHEHSDHIKGIKFVSPSIIYATRGTFNTSLVNHIEYLTPFYINDVKITAIPTNHDAKMPCGYVIEDRGEKFVYITDTGSLDVGDLALLRNPNTIMIESNYDVSLELKAHRSLLCKQRIMSDYGHLSNEDSAFITADIIGDKTKTILLAHISEEANTPATALQAYHDVFKYKGYDINKYNIICAPQWESLKLEV